MLKAIELSGFKSFADRTRLEFGSGICAIVGPNGSGKSNIVDAIKWVLGEQSMKKLRSSDATDVIFNGSAGRTALGSAEVTLTFDNSNHIFGLDSPEVHITRRVYRSGEGEYLINRQAARLKDIKEMLAGTGLGTQAYSIIEQGRVESLLQSSALQRRILFDEAAGISRFNARKQEIQRKYERIDAGLTRLSDKVNELEQQLKSTRNQAGKAQLYRQYSDRLKTIRIQAAAAEYQQRNGQCTSLQNEIAALTNEAEVMTAASLESEKLLAQCNADIESLDEEIRLYEGDWAAVRQRINGEHSTIRLFFAQAAELEDGIAANRQQLLELRVRSTGIEEMRFKTEEDIQKAEQIRADIAAEYQMMLGQDAELEKSGKAKQHEAEALEQDITVRKQQSAGLTGTAGGLKTRLETLQNTKAKDAAKLAKQAEKNAGYENQLGERQHTAAALEAVVEQKQKQLDEAKQRKSSRVKEYAELTGQVSELKQKQSGMKERVSLLEELIRKNEGLSPGVREVLQQSRDAKSPFRHAFGLVADLLRVEFESASLIELALGSVSQHIVVSPKAELFRYIEKKSDEFAGRVGFIWLDPSEQEAPWMRSDPFSGRPGVLGRADQFVQTETKFQHLARRLLGRIWIVQTIAVARQLYKESDDRTSFLTVNGEMLTPDGALIVGPLNTSAGLITRRSELRNLSEQLTMVDKKVLELEIAAALAKDRVDSDEIDVEDETREHQKAVTEYEAEKHQLGTLEEKFKQGTEQFSNLSAEIDKIDLQIAETAAELQQTKMQRTQLANELTVLETQLAETKQCWEHAVKNYEEHQRRTVNTKVSLAKSEERLDSLRESLRHYEDRLKERHKMLTEQRQQCRTLQSRLDAVLLSVLHTESSSASLYLQKEQLVQCGGGIRLRRKQAAAKRSKMQTECKRLQHELETQRTKINTFRLQLEQYLQEQKTTADRIREEYGVDLTAEEATVILSASDNTGTELLKTEMTKLREQIQRLGNVNLEAMETLDELEMQYKRYSEIYNDVVTAKKMTEKDIEMLNGDCQRIFSETFEGVRQHFQEMFRQLFGGGSADLVLDNPDNQLESGIDIIAKPPGKELKNVMLLSGGEKTLTCFALLLAFFRYKPNPVCILDECDAALDEGNVDRYNSVIREFSRNTQFLMITHSKKSMAYAASIYGITMQESGVSKPVSVRFVDVGENGELLKAA